MAVQQARITIMESMSSNEGYKIYKLFLARAPKKKNMWNHVNHVKGMFYAMPCLSRLVSFTPYPRPKEQKKATWKDLGTAGGGEFCW